MAIRMAGVAAIPATAADILLRPTVVEGLPATVGAVTRRLAATVVAADRHTAVADPRMVVVAGTEAATAKRYSGACAKCEAPKRCLSSQVGRITFRVPLFLSGIQGEI